MRRHFQQVRRQLVAHADTAIGWLLAVVATGVYLLTLEPSTSFWDCGEFIAVSYYLQVGHAPGAPFYQLLAHLFTLLAGDNPLAVAPLSNALSAVAGGLAVMFLYWCIRLLQDIKETVKKDKSKNGAAPDQQSATHKSQFIKIFAALIGSLCYLFCDTAWSSAVESEVYSLAMLIASATLWAMLRWYHCPDSEQAQRWLMLIALLLGLGTCTHLLTLLTTPALLLLFIFKTKTYKLNTQKLTASNLLVFSFYLLVFFIIGLSPYLIVPIRSVAGTPINEGNPSTVERFKNYLTREQYEKAPLYPRMWRQHENDAKYAATWSGGDNSLVGNMRYYFSYQLTYMYLRYLMWNFSGRYNDRQGYGSPQNGQFITGIPPLDRILVSTAKPLPKSLPTKGHNVYYLLPLLLGIVGFIATMKRRRTSFWTVLTLFLMGGIVLNFYLNHPCYEPRERDYAYILSFFAFCIFIAFGAEWLLSGNKKFELKTKKLWSRISLYGTYLILLAVPLLMACQNWDDHDRSHRFIAHDSGANILNSCDSNQQGCVLFCYGDNDTFPLWYLQTVEKERLDIRVENIGLMGAAKFAALLDESITLGRPVYFTHYAYNQYSHLFAGRLQLEGNAYRLTYAPCDSVNVEAAYRHMTSHMGWQDVEGVYIDERCCKFLEQYWQDVVLLAENLCDKDLATKADTVLNKTLSEIPLTAIQNPQLIYRISQAFNQAGCSAQAEAVTNYLRHILEEQLDYYHSMPLQRQAVMPYTILPREELAATLTRERF